MGQNDVRRASAINSAACLRMSSALPPAQRVSIRILRPSPAQSLQNLEERRDARLRVHIVLGGTNERADLPHSFRLRPHRERPCRGRAAEQRDELPAVVHSITSSARPSTESVRSRPRPFESSIRAARRSSEAFSIIDEMVGDTSPADPVRRDGGVPEAMYPCGHRDAGRSDRIASRAGRSFASHRNLSSATGAH
jgi:hypothetical protein